MHTRPPLHRKRPQSKTFTAREALRAARGEAGKGSMKYKTWKASLKSMKLGRTSMDANDGFRHRKGLEEGRNCRQKEGRPSGR